jgi:hypothetical protein
MNKRSCKGIIGLPRQASCTDEVRRRARSRDRGRLPYRGRRWRDLGLRCCCKRAHGWCRPKPPWDRRGAHPSTPRCFGGDPDIDAIGHHLVSRDAIAMIHPEAEGRDRIEKQKDQRQFRVEGHSSERHGSEGDGSNSCLVTWPNAPKGRPHWSQHPALRIVIGITVPTDPRKRRSIAPSGLLGRARRRIWHRVKIGAE